MNKEYNIIIVLLLLSWSMHGQYFPFNNKASDNEMFTETSKDSITEEWKNSLVLRKSAPTYLANENSKLAQKGALIAFTIPKEGQASYAINAGVIFGFDKVVQKNDSILFIKSAWLPYLQFDKNTLIDEEQSNLLLGLSYLFNTIDFSKVKTDKKFNLIIKPQIEYREDYKNNLQAVQSSITFSPQTMAIVKKKDGNKKEDKKDVGKLKRVSWICKKFDMDFVAGLEYDYRYNSNITSLEGNLFRTYSKASASFEHEKLTSTIDWEYRYVLANSTTLDKDDFSLLTFGVNYKFKSSTGGLNFKDNIESTISVIHQKGTNPTNGFNNQSYWALTLELKI